MDILTVSSAKWGIQNAVYNLINESTNRGHNQVHLTLPIHTSPEKATKISILNSRLLDLLEKSEFLYLLYAIYYFWYKSYRYIGRDSGRYDIIWLHSPLLLLLCPDLPSGKLVITYHGPLATERADSHRFMKAIYYNIIKNIQIYGVRNNSDAKFTVVDKEIKNTLQEIGVPKENICVVGNGVNTDQFKPYYDSDEAHEMQESAEVNLLYVGRLTKLKQPLKLVNYYKRISSESDKTMSLTMVGEGKLKTQIERKIKDEGLEDSIRLVGAVDHMRIQHVYAAADAFIMMSKYEGEPLVLYEALAAGLPSIAPAISSTQFLENKKFGLVINENKTEESTIEILEFIEGDLEDLRDEARRYAVDNLSWSARFDEYEDILKS